MTAGLRAAGAIRAVRTRRAYGKKTGRAGLDPNERIRFRNLLSELAEDRPVLLSTHIVPDVEYIANEILLMKDGRVLRTKYHWRTARYHEGKGLERDGRQGTGGAGSLI